MKKNVLVTLIWFLLLVILFLLINLFFSDKIEEFKNVRIDEYNFKQLEKAKVILNNIPQDSKKFYSLNEFNELYDINIKPTKNCYYVSNSNGKENYIFWFKLESQEYKNKLWEEYYAYPKYDLPYDESCFPSEIIWFPGEWVCMDMRKERFLGTISNPCND